MRRFWWSNTDVLLQFYFRVGMLYVLKPGISAGHRGSSPPPTSTDFFNRNPHAHTNILHACATVVAPSSRLYFLSVPWPRLLLLLDLRMLDVVFPLALSSYCYLLETDFPGVRKTRHHGDNVVTMYTHIRTDHHGEHGQIVQHGVDEIEIALSGPGAMGVGLMKTPGSYSAMLHPHRWQSL